MLGFNLKVITSKINMDKKIPNVSKFKVGDKVIIGTKGFGIHGKIIKVDLKSKKSQVTVATGLGDPYELSLNDYGKLWRKLVEN